MFFAGFSAAMPIVFAVAMHRSKGSKGRQRQLRKAWLRYVESAYAASDATQDLLLDRAGVSDADRYDLLAVSRTERDAALLKYAAVLMPDTNPPRGASLPADPKV